MALSTLLDSSFVIRDIHLFDERLESDYLRTAGTTTYCEYVTPPVVDGFLWSTPAKHAGLRLVAVNDDDSSSAIPVTSHTCRQSGKDGLSVTCTTPYGAFKLLLKEEALLATYAPSIKKSWALEFTAAEGAKLPFTRLEPHAISATHKGYDYTIRLRRGTFADVASDHSSWRILPRRNALVLSTKTRP